MDILCIGQAVYDITFPVAQEIIENQKYRVPERYECIGAPATNAASLCSLWGAETSIIARIGNDLFGKEIINTLKNINVDTSCIHIESQQSTSISCIIVNSQNGNRTILNSPMQSKTFSVNWSNNSPKAILVDGHEIETALSALNQYPNAVSIIDAGTYKPELNHLIKKIDYLVCSEDFAYQYTKKRVDIKNKKSLLLIFKKLAELTTQQIILTIGNQGVLYQKNNCIYHLPAFDVKVIDTTGAGDIFHGAFTFCIAQHYSLEKAIYISSAASALSTEKLGGNTSVPTLQEVYSFMEKKTPLKSKEI